MLARTLSKLVHNKIHFVLSTEIKVDKMKNESRINATKKWIGGTRKGIEKAHSKHLH